MIVYTQDKQQHWLSYVI